MTTTLQVRVDISVPDRFKKLAEAKGMTQGGFLDYLVTQEEIEHPVTKNKEGVE